MTELLNWTEHWSSWFPGLPFPDGGFPGGSDSKESACSARDLGSIPGSGRSPKEGNGNSLQYSCLENPMNGWAWQAIVHGVAKSQTRLRTSLSFPSLTVYDMMTPTSREMWDLPLPQPWDPTHDPSRQCFGQVPAALCSKSRSGKDQSEV